MKPQEEIAALKKENAELKARIAELESKQSKPSKSRLQAEATLELLKAGPVSSEQLSRLNEKYPSDCIYNVRNILKIDVKTVRGAGGTRYMLPADFERYQAEKKQQSESVTEVTEEVLQAQTASSAAASVTA